MIAKKLTTIALVTALALGIAAPSQAQSFGLRRDQLVELAGILGSIHYLRGQCQRREGQVWRKRMLKLLEVEQPSAKFRSELIQHFNDKYHSEERRFPDCGRKAKDEAGRLALQGRVLTEAMSKDLR